MKTLFPLTASVAFALTMGTVCFGQHYAQTNLVSSTNEVARVSDPQLINPWGMSRSNTSAWWVSVQGAGFTTIYDGAGAKQSLVVTIPQRSLINKSASTGTPTGTIFNGRQADFLLEPGKPAIFLFSTADGMIVGWNPSVAVDQGAAPPSTHAVTVVKTTDGSSYTGLTSAFIDGQPFLYAANFAKGRVDVYDSAFHPVRLPSDDLGGNGSADQTHFSENAFADETVPPLYAPFNVQAIGNDIVVSYAIRRQGLPLVTAGPGLGFVDIYSSAGQLLLRLEHGDWLNAPWGVALAPGNFGRFSRSLLIGQFAGGGETQSSGCIAAYDLTTGKFEGLLQDASGKPLVIKGILSLRPANDNDSTAGPSAPVYFTAGSNQGSGGLFGYLAPIRMEEALLASPKCAGDIHARINSTPAGADIQVDETYVGTTPLDIDLTCCWHDVTISKPGLKPWTGRLRNNGHTNINALLRKRARNSSIAQRRIASSSGDNPL